MPRIPTYSPPTRSSRVLTSVLLALACAPGCVDADQAGSLVPRTVTEDPALPSFELADGTLLHLETHGDPDDPVVIVLHGGPGADYRSYLALAELADERFVVFWDQRGAGLSQRVPEEQIDGPRYLADLDELGRHFSPDRPFDIIGHSWGGVYAAYYVQNHPERVARMVLVEPGALDREAAAEANTFALDVTDPDLNRFAAMSDYFLPEDHARADYYYASLAINNDGSGEMAELPFWRYGLRANHGINDWQGNFSEPNFDFTTHLADFTGPTLLVAGTESDALNIDFQTEFHVPHFAAVTVEVVEGAGHNMLHFDAPRVVPIIRAFLTQEPRS